MVLWSVHNSPMPSPSTKSPSAAQQALQRMGLLRPIDMALHIPLRYEDETQLQTIESSQDGQTVQWQVRVLESVVTARPRRQLRVRVADGTGECWLRFFHFFPSHQKTLSVDSVVRVRGDLRRGLLGNEMVHPAIKPAHGDLPRSLTPVYPTTAGLPQAYLRKAIVNALRQADLCETLPPLSLQRLPIEGRWTLQQALHFLHHPDPGVSIATLEDRSHPAWQRLKAEEWLAQQLSQQMARRQRDALRAPALHPMDNEHGLLQALKEQLPFALTGAQQRVVNEIANDLRRSVPMHRLLQGDVGAGKTVVAALAACICIDAGWQCALMAPTEILAQQHFAKLTQWLEPLLQKRNKRVVWLTGSQRKSQREASRQMIASGEAALVVGTQALIQQDTRFARLGLAIVDEQHRFGVAQRLALRASLGEQAEKDGMPHLLMMTATPIPRTLAMTVMADLDVSTLDELPPGRTPIVTKVIESGKRDEIVRRIRLQLDAGRQVYWVCPLVEESETLDLRNATLTHAQLCEALGEPVCSDVLHADHPPRVALLHARLPAAEKQAVMHAFAAGQIQLLVSTTVIEVGVDVPNATLMVIEHAERFGLSQLHQLRGRVGRGAQASACVLLYESPLGPVARERLAAMARTHDGFELARIDLKLRGAGEFLGARQSGSSWLRFADPQTDEHLLDWARNEALWMLDHAWPQALLHMERWIGGKSEYFKA